VIIQKAKLEDLNEIKTFVDYWLAGRGMKYSAPGAVNDYFISPSQHKKYITKYDTWLVKEHGILLAWAVIQNDRSLIHLLIAGDRRGQGIGKKLLTYLTPPKIHSKSNQSSGNPASFYEKHGYKKTHSIRSKSRLDINKIKPHREKVIDIYEKKIR